MMTPFLLLVSAAWAQTADMPSPVAVEAEMAPYRRQLHETLRDGVWKAASPATVEDAFCLEEFLTPTPGSLRSGNALAVVEGIPLADYVIDQLEYTPRYMRTHYKELGNRVAFWEGSEHQYTQRMLGEYWHDAVWAGRDTLLIRDDAGRVQTIYMEATAQASHCTCAIPGHSDLCPPFDDLDARSPEMAGKGAFYALIHFTWDGDVVTQARIAEVYHPTTGTVRLMAYEDQRRVQASVETVSLPTRTLTPNTCSASEHPLELLSLSWHASKAVTR